MFWLTRSSLLQICEVVFPHPPCEVSAVQKEKYLVNHSWWGEPCFCWASLVGAVSPSCVLKTNESFFCDFDNYSVDGGIMSCHLSKERKLLLYLEDSSQRSAPGGWKQAVRNGVGRESPIPVLKNRTFSIVCFSIVSFRSLWFPMRCISQHLFIYFRHKLDKFNFKKYKKGQQNISSTTSCLVYSDVSVRP